MSKRPPSFTVTAAGQKVALDDSGEGKASFTVTNTSPQALQGRLLARPREPAKPEWFTVVGESLRDFAPNAAEQVVVQLKVPPGTTPGSYSFRLDAVSEDDPDEDFTEGPSVAFDVTAPPPPKKKKFPWWILAIVGAVVLLIVIGVVVWLLVRDTGPESATVPAVVGQPAAAAQSTLTGAGFTVTTQSIPVRDPTQNGVVQSQDPAAGTVHPPATVVTITVGRKVRVPDVTGLTQANAEAVLNRAGLKSSVKFVPFVGERFRGLVSEQIPVPGTRLQLEGVVEIHVNRFRVG
jgi:PASTA domain